MATNRMAINTFLNCPRKIIQGDIRSAELSSLVPYSTRRWAASVELRPEETSLPSCCTTVVQASWCHSLVFILGSVKNRNSMERHLVAGRPTGLLGCSTIQPGEFS